MTDSNFLNLSAAEVLYVVTRAISDDGAKRGTFCARLRLPLSSPFSVEKVKDSVDVGLRMLPPRRLRRPVFRRLSTSGLKA